MTESDASAATREPERIEDTTDYDEMLETLDIAIEEAKRKVESGRVYDAENEKVRIKWIRGLAYVMKVRRQVAQDRDLEELTREVEELKEALDEQP